MPGIQDLVRAMAAAGGPGFAGNDQTPAYSIPGTLSAPQTMQQPQQSQPQFNMQDFTSAYRDQSEARSRMQLANAIANTGYTGAGPLGAIAQVLNAYMGSKMAKDANEKYSDAAARIFEMENRMKVAQFYAEQDAKVRGAVAETRAKSQAEHDRLVALADELHLVGDERKELLVNGKTERQKLQLNESGVVFDPVTGQARIDPEAQKASLAKATAGRSSVSVDMKGQGAFQEELGKKDAATYTTYRDDAMAATDIKNRVAQLRQVLNAQQTGKTQEALALAGQYFGSEAGANLQATQKLVGPLVLKAAQQLKPVSNSDMQNIERQMPNFGSDPKANEMALNILDAAADKQIGLYKEATDHVAKHNSLQGFQPSVIYQQRQATASPPTSEPTATDPKTGKRVAFRNGQWEPI